jgi:hypothetical protein
VLCYTKHSRARTHERHGGLTRFNCRMAVKLGAWVVGVSRAPFFFFNSAYRAVVRRRRRALCVRASRDRKGRALKHPIHTHLFSGWIPFGGAGRGQGEPCRAKGITSSRPSREHGSCVDAAARCRERVGDPRIGPFFFFAHDVGVFFSPLSFGRDLPALLYAARGGLACRPPRHAAKLGRFREVTAVQRCAEPSPLPPSAVKKRATRHGARD